MAMKIVDQLNRLGGLLLLGSLSACTPQLVQLMRSPDTAMTGKLAGWAGSLRLHRQQLSVQDKGGQKQYVPLSAVWGYRTRWGEQYRLVDGEAFKVVQAGPVWVYQIREWIGDAAWETPYFSLEPNSAVFLLDKPTCLVVFRQDSCLYERLSHAKTGQLIKVDSQGAYGLSTLFELCHPPISTYRAGSTRLEKTDRYDGSISRQPTNHR